MKYRWIAGLLAVLMGLTISGCGEQQTTDTQNASDSAATEETASDDITEALSEDAEEGTVTVTETDTDEDAVADLTDTADPDEEYVTYTFRNDDLLEQHYEKHGEDMGFDSPEEYEEAASDVVNNPEALTKTEAEDGDYVYYVEDTNEFVIVSMDGYLRTYFYPNAGKSYYDRQ